MSNRLETGTADVWKSTFVLAVEDLAASRAFWVERLGFHVDKLVDGWAFLSRGECHVRIGDCPGIRSMRTTPDHSWFAYLHVNDAQALFEEYQRREVPIWHPVEDKPWGLREFGIVTPDGHRIVFGQILAKT